MFGSNDKLIKHTNRQIVMKITSHNNWVLKYLYSLANRDRKYLFDFLWFYANYTK